MYTKWDDDLLVVQVELDITEAERKIENLVLDMAVLKRARPHRLDPVTQILRRLWQDGYNLDKLSRIDLLVTAKEHAI